MMHQEMLTFDEYTPTPPIKSVGAPFSSTVVLFDPFLGNPSLSMNSCANRPVERVKTRPLGTQAAAAKAIQAVYLTGFAPPRLRPAQWASSPAPRLIYVPRS